MLVLVLVMLALMAVAAAWVVTAGRLTTPVALAQQAAEVPQVARAAAQAAQVELVPQVASLVWGEAGGPAAMAQVAAGRGASGADLRGRVRCFTRRRWQGRRREAADVSMRARGVGMTEVLTGIT